MTDRQPGDRARAFVSYRTTDAGDVAARLAGELKQDLGLADVYHAPADNRPLDDWVANIEHRLAQSHVVLALLGAHWVGCAPGGPHGGCIHEREDWVRREVAFGLRHRQALPILVDVPRVPTERLPDDLVDLARVHGVGLHRSEPFETGYQAVLTACWISFRDHRRRSVLVITDDGVEAEARLDRLVETLLVTDLASARRLSSTVQDPRGLRAVPLADAAQRWPDVIVLAEEATPALLARVRGLRESRTVERVAFVVVGASLAVLGGALVDAASAQPSPNQAPTEPASPDPASPDPVRVLDEHRRAMDADLFSSPDELTGWMRGGPRGVPRWVPVAAAMAVVTAVVAGLFVLWNPPPTPPPLRVAPAAFGTVVVDQEATTSTSIVNDGDAPARIDGIVVAGLPFDVATTGCAGETLPPGASCELVLRATPTVAADEDGTIRVRFQVVDQEIAESASGVVTLSARFIEVAAVMEPAVLDLGEVPVDADARGNLVVTNNGEAPVTVAGIGEVDAPFRLVDHDCDRTIEPDDVCTIVVGVRPAAIGAAAASVEVEVAGGDRTVSLSASVTATGSDAGGSQASRAPRFDPAEVDLGDVRLGTAREFEVAVVNDGDGSLSVGGFDLDPPDAGFDVVDAEDCVAPIPTGGECRVVIVAAPAAEGSVTAVLAVAVGSETPASAVLTAAGVRPRLRSQEVVEVPNDGTEVPLPLVNEGGADAALALGDVRVEPPRGVVVHAGDCPGVLAPSATCALVLTADAPAGAVAEVVVPSDDPDGPLRVRLDVVDRTPPRVAGSIPRWTFSTTDLQADPPAWTPSVLVEFDGAIDPGTVSLEGAWFEVEGHDDVVAATPARAGLRLDVPGTVQIPSGREDGHREAGPAVRGGELVFRSVEPVTAGVQVTLHLEGGGTAPLLGDNGVALDGDGDGSPGGRYSASYVPPIVE